MKHCEINNNNTDNNAKTNWLIYNKIQIISGTNLVTHYFKPNNVVNKNPILKHPNFGLSYIVPEEITHPEYIVQGEIKDNELIKNKFFLLKRINQNIEIINIERLIYKLIAGSSKTMFESPNTQPQSLQEHHRRQCARSSKTMFESPNT